MIKLSQEQSNNDSQNYQSTKNCKSYLILRVLFVGLLVLIICAFIYFIHQSLQQQTKIINTQSYIQQKTEPLTKIQLKSPNTTKKSKQISSSNQVNSENQPIIKNYHVNQPLKQSTQKTMEKQKISQFKKQSISKPSMNYPLNSQDYPIFNYSNINTKLKQSNNSKETYQLAIAYLKLGLKSSSHELQQKQRIYYEQKYQISKFKSELRFCIVVASYNNVMNSRYIFNLNSIFRQKYTNYHVAYVDDASLDQNYQAVKRYIINQNIDPKKLNIIKNSEHKKPLYSQNKVAKLYCKQQQIIIILDGDDAMIGVYTLQLLNSIYQSKDVWFVYTNSLYAVTGHVGPSTELSNMVIEQKTERFNFGWRTSHMKSFYGKLFFEIKQKDLLDHKGNYFETIADRVIVYPMIQMSVHHTFYLPQMLYLYNDRTEISQYVTSKPQALIDKETLQSYTQYQTLQCLFRDEQNNCIKSSQYVLKLISSQS